jgi:hypothetical protein
VKKNFHRNIKKQIRKTVNQHAAVNAVTKPYAYEKCKETYTGCNAHNSAIRLRICVKKQIAQYDNSAENNVADDKYFVVSVIPYGINKPEVKKHNHNFRHQIEKHQKSHKFRNIYLKGYKNYAEYHQQKSQRFKQIRQYFKHNIRFMVKLKQFVIDYTHNDKDYEANVAPYSHCQAFCEFEFAKRFFEYVHFFPLVPVSG